MELFYFGFFLYCLPLFLIYFALCLIVPLVRLGEIKKGKGKKLYICKDLIHSDYIFESKDLKDLFEPQKKFIKVGWGDRKIFLETKTWSDLKLVDFIFAFFGLNKTVLRTEYLDQLPNNHKEIDIDERQLSVLIVHISESFNRVLIVKKESDYQYGDYYESSLRYNCIKNCNNWTNYGLYMARITNRIWCPLSFWI